MSDELEPKDELLDEEDEELMSDFKDLFPEDEDAAGDSVDTAEETSDDGLDELDAFLDDFEKNLDIPDADAGSDTSSDTAVGTAPEEAPEASAESADEAEAAAEREALELDESELDLDVGLTGDVAAETEEAVADSSEPEANDDDDDLSDIESMLDESEEKSEQAEMPLEVPAAAAATAAAAASTAAPSAKGVILPPTAPALSKGLIVGGVAMLTCSVLLSVGALWIGMGLGSQIDVLNQNVSDLQQRVVTLSRRGVIAPQAQMVDQLNRLGERVNELAVIVEGPVGHLQDLSARLDAMEKSQSQPAMATPAPAKPASPKKPLVSKAKPALVAESPKPAVKGGWVINLLTVASANTASEELTRLRKMGVRADKQAISKDGKTLYRLRVTGFDSYEGAKAYIETVEKQTGFSSAWVAKE